MHPVIRVFCLIVLATALSVGAQWQHVLLGAVVVSAGYLWAQQRGLRKLWVMVTRLRWLWLSLCVVYFWFTPGAALFPQIGGWSPSVPGVREGLVRVGILLELVAGAHLLLQSTPRERLLGAVHWLVTPLRRFGASPDRFALRLVLVLEVVPQIRPLTRSSRSRSDQRRGRVARLAGAAAEVFRATLEQAATSSLHPIDIPDSGAPPAVEWLYPLLFAVGFWLVGHL
jgi:energy-coupling factor transporter transmembrane protein EcfT